MKGRKSFTLSRKAKADALFVLSHELDGVDDDGEDEMELQVDVEGGYVSDGTGYRRASSSRNKLVRSLGSVNYNEMMVLDPDLSREKKKRKNTADSAKKKKGKKATASKSSSRRGKRAGSDGEAEFQFNRYSSSFSSSMSSSDSDSDSSSGSESESDWRDPSWVIDENEEEERRRWAEEQKKKAEERTKRRSKRRTLTSLPSDDNTTGTTTPTTCTTPTITPSSTPPTSSSREGSEESGSNNSTPRSPKKLDKRFSLRRFKEKTTINNPSIKGSQTARGLDSPDSLDQHQQPQQDVLHQSSGFTEVRKGRVKKSLWSVRSKKKKSGSYIGSHKCRSEGDPGGLNGNGGNHNNNGNNQSTGLLGSGTMSTSPKSPFKNFLYSLGGKNRGRSISCTTSPQLRKDTSEEYLDASSLRSRSVSVAY